MNGRSDEFFTPEYAVKPILKYLERDKIIWCPFDTEESNFVKMLKERGFNSHWDYLKFIYKKNYGTTPVKRKEFLARKNGFKSFYHRAYNNLKERGFNDITELRDFLARKNGFKNHSERRKLWRNKKRKEWKENGSCTSCGKGRDKHNLQCNHCLELKKKSKKQQGGLK